MNTEFIYLVIDSLAKAINPIHKVAKDSSLESIKKYQPELEVLGMVDLSAFRRHLESLSEPNKVLVLERFRANAYIDDGNIILPLKKEFHSILLSIDLAIQARDLFNQELNLNGQFKYFAKELKGNK